MSKNTLRAPKELARNELVVSSRLKPLLHIIKFVVGAALAAN